MNLEDGVLLTELALCQRQKDQRLERVYAYYYKDRTPFMFKVGQ